MKKIMLFRPLIYVGGTELAMLNLVQKLKGFEIYIGYSDDTSNKGVLDEFNKFAKVIDIKKEIPKDLDIFIPCTDSYYLDSYAKKINRKKTILWMHHLKNYPKSALSIKEEYEKIDCIVCVSKTEEKDLRKLYPHLKNKIKPIYNVLNIEKIKKKSLVPIDLNFSNTLNLVTVCRVCKEKGFNRMLYLAEYLKKANIDFKWFVVGDNYYEEESKKIIKKFDKYKDNFVWFGFLDNPHNIVKNCDYSVLLSDSETWGLVITEAMIMGIPSIATNFGSVYEQLVDKKNGIILDKDNPSSYKDRIQEILNDKEKYKKAVSNFTYDNDKPINDWMEVLND